MNTPNALTVVIATLRAIAENAYALAADHIGAIKLLLDLRNSGTAPDCVTDDWIDMTRIRYIQHCAPDTEHSTRLSQQLAAIHVAIEEGLARSGADVEVPAADDGDEYPDAFLTAVEAVLALPDAADSCESGVRYVLQRETHKLMREPRGSLEAAAQEWADEYTLWLTSDRGDTESDDDLSEATTDLRAAYVAYREHHAIASGPNAEPANADGGLLPTSRWCDWQDEIRAAGAAADIDQWLTELREVLGVADDEGESEPIYSAAQGLAYARKHWHTMWCEAADKLGAVRNALGVSLGDDIVGKARHLTERLALAERKAQDLDETRAVLGTGPSETVVAAAMWLVDTKAELVKERHEVRDVLGAAEGESAVEAAKRQMDRVADRDREIAQLRATMADQTSAYEAGAAQHGERFQEIERELKQARNQAAAAEMAGDQALAHVRADHEAALAGRDRRIGSLSARLTNHQHVIARVASVLGAIPGESPEAAARRMVAALADRDRRIERLCVLMADQGSMCKTLEAQADTVTPELASAIVDALAGPFTVGSLFGMPRADVIAAILALRPVEVHVEEDHWDTPIDATPPRPRPTWKALADAVKAYLDAWDGTGERMCVVEALNAEIGYLEHCAPATDEDRLLLHAAERRHSMTGIDTLRRALADWTLALVASSKENP